MVDLLPNNTTQQCKLVSKPTVMVNNCLNFTIAVLKTLVVFMINLAFMECLYNTVMHINIITVRIHIILYTFIYVHIRI